jgi:Na+/proline symporter
VAFAHFPALADADAAYPTLVAELMPAGMKGLFLAAFLAALMSSVDSYLNSAATILVNDIYRRFIRPAAADTHLLTVGRITTIVLVCWAIAFALYLSRLEGTGIYTIFQTLMAFFQGPALAILLCGLFWRRATGPAALLGFIVGVATAVTLFALSQEPVYSALGWPPLFKIQEPYLYFSVWSFLVAGGLVVAVSVVTPPEPAAKTDGLTLRRGGVR